MTTKVLKIGGMTCAACAQRVEKSIKKLDGVESVSVNLITENATVFYNPEKIRLTDIRGAIERAGYEILENEKDNSAERNNEQKQKDIQTIYSKLIISAVFCIPLFYIAMAPMVELVNLPLSTQLHHMMENDPLLFALIELILVIPIICIGYKFYTVGYKSLLHLSPNMDSLIAIGSTAAVLYSVYNVGLIANGHPDAVNSLYFETAGVIITLVLLGKTLEAVSKMKAGKSIAKLMELTPKTAVIIQNGKEKEISIGEIEIGDMIVIKPGAKIPVDGTVTDGYTTIDESMLTGESMPKDKKAGDRVYAATVNSNGSIRFKAEKIGSDTLFAQIVKMVEDAQGSKAPIAKTADTISGYFVPAVCIISLLAGAAWFFAKGGDIGFALMISISVLVVACPCALGLATPTAILVGTGVGAEKGILIKNGEALENAHNIDTVVFDKTGTITNGKPVVTDVIATDGTDPDDLLLMAASAENGSEHPLGRAVVTEAYNKGMKLQNADDFISITGYGVRSTIGGLVVLIGNQKLMTESNISFAMLEADSNRMANEGKTLIYIAVGGKPAGVIGVADVVRNSSKTAVESLHKMGINVVMITGDNRTTADSIAEQVGIDCAISEVLPNDKANEIKKLQSDGHKIAMIGDGINDAPALMQADVGIAVGSGTDIAMESADIVLMHSDPVGVPTAIHLSRRVIRNIRENLFWALGYNAFCIPVAAGVLYIFGGPLLNPMIAALAMSLSSVSVVANALRLKRFTPLK